MCAYRDRFAQRVDLPHFKVLSNDLLVEISRRNPQTLDELEDVPGMSPRVFKRHADGLLQAVIAGRTAPILRRERAPKPEQAVLDRLNVLHVWRKESGKKLQVESDVVLPRDYMEKIAAKNPRNLVELKALMKNIPWRFDHYGKEIFDTIHPKG
jgi:ribonuclease D